jgi:hypothetical protein
MSPQIQALKLKLTGLLTSISEQIASKLDATAPAVSAYKLTNPFNLIVTGDATGTQSVSGDTNVSIALTLANTAVAPGVYPKVTVDSKGRITKGELLLAADIPALDASKVTTGAFHVDRIPALPTSKVTGLDTALNSKLNAALYTAADVLAKLITVDGAGSGIDADALDGKQLATIESEYKAFCNAAIAALVDSSPEALNTLNELATALGNDPNFATTIATQLGTKVNDDDVRLTNSREWTASTITQAEAEAGIATTRRAFTAQRVRQAIVAWWIASAEKAKLDGIATGATANATDAQLRDRATHTGTQAIDTVSGLQTELDAKVNLTDSRLTDAREWTGVTVAQAEAEAGTATTRRAWTAQRVRQAIVAWWAGSADKTKLDGIQAGAQVNVATNLSYTAAASNGTVASSTGSNATLPAATTAAAGLMTAADKTKLDGLSNVGGTDLGYTSSANAGTVTSSTGANATLPAATAAAAGLLTASDKSKLDGIQPGAQANVATNLTWSATATGGTVASSTGGNAALTAATTALAGLMTAADKSKLNDIDAGATANSADATLLNRANHTGSQAISTITNLQASLDAKFNSTGGTVSGVTTFSNTGNATSATSGAVRVSGGLGVVLDIYAGGNITAYSDLSLKTDIQVISDALSRIRRSRGVTFTRKDTGQVQAGFIAQEMYKILPEVVVGVPGSGKMGICYGNITALLAEGVKELDGIVIAQGERIVSLEAQVTSLSQRIDELQALFEELVAK